VPYDGMHVPHASPRNALQATCRATATSLPATGPGGLQESAESSTGMLGGAWTVTALRRWRSCFRLRAPASSPPSVNAVFKCMPPL
jgi:hypothetical protein